MLLTRVRFCIEGHYKYEAMLAKIEDAARTCYKSGDKVAPGTAEKLIRRCINQGHESVLEHEVISVRIVCDRGVTHELVRHRLMSFSQESTRYVKYDGDMEFIKPAWWDNEHDPKIEAKRGLFTRKLEAAEVSYKEMLELGCSPQEARALLPNALAAEIVATANIREWRHVFKLRCAKAAHPDMRMLMISVCNEFKDKYPVFFEDITY